MKGLRGRDLNLGWLSHFYEVTLAEANYSNVTRDTDDPAQQGDGELCGLSLDEPEPRHGRSVSLAKKAAARFRTSRS